MSLYGHLLGMLGRGRIKAVRDDGTVQKNKVQFSSAETLDELTRLSDFGFTSNPPNDSDAIVLFIGADRSKGVIIATGHQTYRLKSLGRGEAALYDAFGHYIKLTASGPVIEANGHDVTINNTSKLKVNGPIEATGDITSGGNVKDSVRTMAADRAKYNAHKHSETGSITGVSDTPE
jgi:phage baseplate assembly protein V